MQAAREEVHTALRACVDAARACVRNVADGGADVAICRQNFHACVQEALPPPPPLPPCVQSLKDCLEDAADGGPEARMACKEQFQTCAIAQLPPCMRGFATCLDEGGSLRECLAEGRACRDYRQTHDGGTPPPAP